MKELDKLPRGYRIKVNSLKSQLNELLKEISRLGASRGYTERFDSKLSSISMHLAIKNSVTTESGVTLHFEHCGLVGTIYADRKTGKFTLGKKFDLKIAELDSVVYNCKW